MFAWRSLTVVWLLISANCAGPLLAQAERDKLPDNLQRFDRNQDNKISQRELPRKLRAEAFPKYDKDQDGALDRRELMSFLQGRKEKTPAKRPNSSAALVKMKRVLNLQYANTPSHRPGFGSLDIYLPEKGQLFPVLFFVHGGALVKGDKSSLASNAGRFVEQGYAVVAVNYRLSPAVKFPAHIEDVAQAFAWVHKNIGKYGGDQKRIFVAGGSAGGYLATLLTLDPRYLRKHDSNPSLIVGTISISGLMNTEPVPAERLAQVWSRDPEVVRRASPQEYVRKDAPPILIMFADGDTAGRKQQNRRMGEMLERVGHPDVTVRELANRTHDSLRAHLAEPNDPGLRIMLDFMKRIASK